MARFVRFRVLDGIAVVTLDAEPVNALSAAMRAGLWQVFTRINDNPDIKVAVLVANGRMFSAGEDIREFSAKAGQPSLRQLCDLIENCTKPVVAGCQADALGGGVELLLAAHYRLATPTVRIGLPEVALGLVPSGGGTQRLPRLIGPDRALQMMISAQSIDAVFAYQSGFLDGIVQDDIVSGAMTFAQDLHARGQGPRRTCDTRAHFKNGLEYSTAIAKGRAALKDKPLHAPERVVDCVEAAVLLPFDAGLEFEADAFERCLAHPQSAALRHVFMAERKTDEVLIARSDGAFRPVAPMGKSTVQRLRKAMTAAAKYLLDTGLNKAEIDGAMVAYGFRRGPFQTKDVNAANDIIVRRLVAALLAEGAACVEHGAVQRPSDIDALAVHGMGFPRRHGGPMRAAQAMGLIGLRRDMRNWAQDSDLWAVPALLDEAIKNAHGFDALS